MKDNLTPSVKASTPSHNVAGGVNLFITKEDFEYYIDRGYSVGSVMSIGLQFDEKKQKYNKTVYFEEWGHLQENYANEEEIEYWVNKKNKGILLVTGELSGVVVVDVDEKDQSKYKFLQNTPLQVRTANSKGVHYYFKWNKKLQQFGPQTTLMNLPMDYRGRGGCVFLPKTDVGGKTYEIIKGSFDINPMDLPELPDEIFQDLSSGKQGNGETFLKTEHGSILLPELEEGNRNQETTRVIGSILSRMPMDLWEPIALPAIANWNEHSVHPPQDFPALKATFDQIAMNETRKRSLELVPKIYRSSFFDLATDALLKPDEGFFETGYEKIDEALGGGLKYRNTYLVSGLDKSGKSSWLMKILQMKLDKGIKIGFFNTELPIEEFLQRMTAQHLQKNIDDVTKEEMIAWNKKFKNKFEYIGAEQISNSENEELESEIKDMMEKNIECLVFDNITTRGTKMIDGKDGYQIIADMLQKLVTLTKEYKVVSFAVIHTKQNIVISAEKPPSMDSLKEGPKGARAIMHRASNPWIRRPVLGDIYGGGQILSQVSGTIFIYRPFQKFEEKEYGKITGIVLESMRHCSNEIVNMNFYGEKGLFVDYEDDTSPEATFEKFTK